MSETQNLGLPYMEAGQAQKHVTHNEALRLLDRVVQLAVQDIDLTAPPDTPAEGQRWIVKAAATDAWASHDNQIAAWQDGAWEFTTPSIGWLAYVVDDENLVAWGGTAWHAVSAGSGGGSGGDLTELQNMSLLGIGTEADTTNPVSARLNNVLWAAQTVADGGDGTLRYKLSKESADKTLSFLFQDDFVGCAEIGLAGDDDFHFKVSPDGSAWLESIKIDRATGRVLFPSGGAREMLTANRTYYVRVDGSDGNDGLADSADGAFATVNKAYNTIVAYLDLAGKTVTIQLGDGTYAGQISAGSPWTGGGSIVVTGENATGTIISTAADCIATGGVFPGALKIQNIKLVNTGGKACINHGALGKLQIGANVEFGSADSGYHIRVLNPGAYMLAASGYKISGGAFAHAQIGNGAFFQVEGNTVTLTGTPAFTGYYLWMTGAAIARITAAFSGSATGIRYAVTENSVATGGGIGANYLPGNSAGSTTTGGQYSL